MGPRQSPSDQASANSILLDDRSVFLASVQRVIDSELANASFTVDDLARALGLSTRQLYRRLDEHSASPPGTMLRRMRLARAARLLRRDGAKVSDAARAAGYRDTRHFSKLFRQTFGILPAEYRDGGESDTGEWTPGRSSSPE